MPLSTVLAEAGVKPAVRWVLAEGADAAAMSRSIPLSKALDDALLAYAQNGERLRPEQGYSLRLLLPGFEGNMSVKWLRRLKVGDQPFETREETSKYTDLMPDGRAAQYTFLMEVKSVITHPSGGQTLTAPGFREISGLAWSGRGRIRRVDVSVDGGRSWQEARLQEPVLPRCLTRFRLPWRWSGAGALLQSRATDETGAVQPGREVLLAARGLSSAYHNNGIHTWRVRPDADGFSMSSERLRACVLLAAMTLIPDVMRGGPPGPGPYGQGAAAGPPQIAAWDIDVRADGQGLPPGMGSVEEGAALFAQTCASCHGAGGQEGPAERLVGGIGTLATPHPVKTVGSYWPHAPTLFDYIRRAMPYDRPQSLQPTRSMRLVAFLLKLNGIVPAG